MEDVYEWLMFVYAMLRIIANIWVASYMIYLFVKNLKEPYIDAIKLLQTSFVFLWFFSDIITILISIFDSNLLDNPIVTTLVILTDPYMFWYGFNQFAWLILIQHLITYRKFAQDKSYSEWRKSIRSKEIKLFTSSIIILSILMIIQICLYIMKTTLSEYNDLIKKIINIEGLIVNISFTIIEYTLYLKVTKTLEMWLNSYYKENKKSLRCRMLLNIWYFSIFNVLFIVNLLTPNSVNLMVTFNIVPPYKGALNIVYIFGILLTDIPVIIYAWINAKNIKFRDWIIIVMEGHRILKNFHGCSIFIWRNRLFKSKPNSTNIQEVEDDNSFSVSFNAGFEKDYDENSEYQRNYKLKFSINSEASK